MEHPLVTDAQTLSNDDLQSRISDLSRKLSWAHRANNAALRHQIQMALATYQNEWQNRQKQMFDQQKLNQGSDFTDRIDIS